ncbi:unnamed protein product, partial [Prorocentrum cordatum]
GSCRFKRAAKKSASFGAQEMHEDEETARLQHRGDAEGVGIVRATRRPRNPVGAQMGLGAGGSSASSRALVSISDGSELDGASSVLSCRSNRPQSLGHGLRRYQNDKGGPRSDAGCSSGPSPRTPCMVSKIKASEGPEEPPTAKPKKHKQTNANSVDGGRQLIEEGESNWGNSLLWSRKYRNRDFENLLTRLSARASKTSSLDQEGAAAVAEELYQLSVQFEDARNFVAMLRDSPESVVLQLGETGIDFFKKIDEATMANVSSTLMLTLVSHSSADVVKLGLQVAKYQKTFTDKVIKKNSMQSFIDIMGSCSAILVECDMDAIDTSSQGINDATGWCPVALADLHALRCFAQVHATDPKDKPPRALWVLGVQLVNNKGKLSSRLRACMRVSAGTACWAKAAWDRLPTSSSAGCAGDCVLQDSVVKSVRQFVEGLGDAICRLDNQRGIASLWGMIGGMAADDEILASVEAFSKYFDGLDDNGDTKDVDYAAHVALRDNVVRLLCDSISRILGYDNNFSMGLARGDCGDADPFKVLSKVAWPILLFDIPPPARATIKDMKSRCDVIVKVNIVKTQCGMKPCESSLMQWSDAWQDESVISCAPKLPSDDALPAMRAETFNKVASELKDALPPDVQLHVAAVRAYNLIKGTATSCLQGKLVGCMQATSALKSHADLVAPVGDKAELKEWKPVLIGEWGKRFQDILKKVDLWGTQAFLNKYGPDGENLLALISAWDFGGEGKQSWLASPTRDPTKEQDMKAVGSFVMSFGPVERALEDLGVARSSLHWLDPLSANRLNEAIVNLPRARGLKKSAAVLMCSTVLCNACLTGIGKNDARKCVTERVMVNFADLPPKLVEVVGSE